MAKKNRVLWIVLGIGLFGFFGMVLIFAGLVAAVSKQEKIADKSVLELTISGALGEGPSQNPFEEVMARFEGDKKQHLWNIRRALEKAAIDPKIAALRLDIQSAAGGWAVEEELQDLLKTFRESGKSIYTYLPADFAGNGEYFLATAGDQIWLSPEAGMIVKGLRFEVAFWRGTLEKLHIDPYFIMYKEYKSAGEPYSRYEMSEYFREHLTAVGEDMTNSLIQTIADRRSLDRSAVEEAVNRGLMTSTEALEAHWVDKLGYQDELEKAISDAVGAEKYEGVPLAKYLKSVKTPSVNGDRVALIFGEGPIVSVGEESPFGGPTIFGGKVAETFEDAIENDSVKAILFRVNSPGGSAVGSDYIWRAMKKAKEAGKPVVVSMSTVAGSGGYWVSMAADKIVAQPTTITGSIGVVFGKFNVRGFYEWIGANVSDVTLARNADLMSGFEPLKPEHEARFRAWMDEVYGHFKEKVANGRSLDVSRVEEIAKGRIWSGVDAKDLGLVDEVGGLDVALKLAREIGGLNADAPVQIFPKQKEFLEMLASGDFEVKTAHPDGIIETALRPLFRKHPESAITLQMMTELEAPHPWVLMPPFSVE